MHKMPKGNKSGEVSKNVPDREEAFKNVADGSMEYLSKQDKFCREDTSKLKRNSFKDSRYS